MARPGLAHEATRAGRAGRSRMSTELGVVAQSSRPVSATSLPRHLGQILSHFCTSVSSSVQWGLNLRVRRSPAAGLGFCPKAFQNLEPRSFSPRTALGGLTTHTPWLTSRQLCPNAPWALRSCGDTRRDGGLGLVPRSCRMPGETRRPPRLGSGWSSSGRGRGTPGTRLAQFPHSTALAGSPRGGRGRLSLEPGPGRRCSYPLGPCCRPRRPSSPARGRGRPVAVLRLALAPRTRAPCWKQHLVASARLWGSRRGPFPELSSPGGPFPEPSPPPTAPSSLRALVAGSRASQVEGGVGRGAGVAHSQARLRRSCRLLGRPGAAVGTTGALA